jgi:hypothetical protein
MPRPSNTHFSHYGFEHCLPQFQNPSILGVTDVDDSEKSLGNRYASLPVKHNRDDERGYT